MMRKLRTPAVIALALLATSCVLTPEKNIDSVYVMVYDLDNNEVMNAAISVDGEPKGTTDIYGRLIYTADGEKECTVRAEKEGYESAETVTCIRPGQLVYFRLGTGEWYAAKAEELLDGNDPEKALSMIDRALAIRNRKDWQFLKDVILRRLNHEK